MFDEYKAKVKEIERKCNLVIKSFFEKKDNLNTLKSLLKDFKLLTLKQLQFNRNHKSSEITRKDTEKNKK